MGLLRSDDFDLECLQNLFQGFVNGYAPLFQTWGFSLNFYLTSLRGMSEIASENLFDGVRFPSEPGAFKRAAAVALFTRMFVDMEFQPVDPAVPLHDLYTED